jgi:hypothetical protein
LGFDAFLGFDVFGNALSALAVLAVAFFAEDLPSSLVADFFGVAIVPQSFSYLF